MLIEEIHGKVEGKLKNQLITSRVLLDRLRLIDETSRRSSQYQDPRHLPFYYYLGKSMEASSVLHVGLDLGLPLCCFLQGSPATERIMGFQRKDKAFYSPRLALSNLKDVKGKGLDFDFYHGGILDPDLHARLSRGFDLVILTERLNSDQLSETLDVCWNYLNMDGFLVLDHAKAEKNMGDVFSSFCKAKNRPLVLFDTRYGAGLTHK
jgi:hypothetical protein